MADRDEPRFDPDPHIGPPSPEELPPEPVFEPEPIPGREVGRPEPSPSSAPAEEEPWYGQEIMAAGFDSTRARRARGLVQAIPRRWLVGGLVVAILVVAIAFTRPEPGNETATPTPGLAQQPAVGPAVETAPPVVVVTATVPAPPTPTPVRTFAVGQRVVVVNTDGQGIRLRNAPGLESLTLEIYDEGRIFQVLEPGPEHTIYPVEADGYRWYRVQVADDPQDQLSGWVAGEFLAPAP